MEGSENSDANDTEPEYVSYRPPDAEEQAAEERSARSIFDFNEESEEEKKEAPKTAKLDASDIQSLDEEREKQAAGKNNSRSRSAATTVTVIVLLILVLIGGWIILGQRGIIPSPSRTLGLSDGLTEPINPSVTPEGSNTSAATNGTSSPSASERAATPSASEDNTSTSTSTTERDAGVTSNDEVSSGSRGFDASAGEFTIAVASRESESEARALVEQFRRNLSDTNLRIDLVSGQSGGTIRYRVGVGQFATRSEATEMRNQMQNRLPDGAWPVPIN